MTVATPEKPKAAKAPKAAPKTAPKTVGVKRPRRPGHVLLAELEAKRNSVMDRAAIQAARLDEKLNKLHARYASQAEVAKLLQAGDTPEGIEALVQQQIVAARALRKALRKFSV